MLSDNGNFKAANYYLINTETAHCDRDGCTATDTRTAHGTKLIDTTAPTGKIKISKNSFESFVNSITFGLFFKESQTVAITGDDAGIGLDKIYYFKSETALTLDEIKALSPTRRVMKQRRQSPFTLTMYGMTARSQRNRLLPKKV